MCRLRILFAFRGCEQKSLGCKQKGSRVSADTWPRYNMLTHIQLIGAHRGTKAPELLLRVNYEQTHTGITTHGPRALNHEEAMLKQMVSAGNPAADSR